jgi:hypothetical protein
MAAPGSLSDYLEGKFLAHVLGNTAYTAPTTLYIALFTTMPADDGTGGVEVSGGSYVRKSVANNTTNFPVANPTISTLDLSFVQATASWGTVVGAGVYDASSAGNLLWYSRLVGAKKVISSVDTTGDTVTSTSHGFSNAQTVTIWHVDGGVPGGLTAFTNYYVVGSTANTFQFSNTVGGAAIDITTIGSGALYAALSYSQVVNNGTIFTIPTGAFSLALD